MINTVEEIINVNETAAQIKARLKSEFPSLRTGNEETGYTELSDEAYDAKIVEWVVAHLAKIENKKTEIAKAAKKAALLDRLGINEDEAKLLLS